MLTGEDMNDDQDYNQFFHGYRAPAPVFTPPSLDVKTDDYEKDIKQLKQEVSQLKEALKAIMDLLGKHGASNHPLY
jgi:DNA-directed RNA polymerase subunit L